jgi:hypothetical protein
MKQRTTCQAGHAADSRPSLPYGESKSIIGRNWLVPKQSEKRTRRGIGFEVGPENLYQIPTLISKAGNALLVTPSQEGRATGSLRVDHRLLGEWAPGHRSKASP